MTKIFEMPLSDSTLPDEARAYKFLSYLSSQINSSARQVHKIYANPIDVQRLSSLSSLGGDFQNIPKFSTGGVNPTIFGLPVIVDPYVPEGKVILMRLAYQRAEFKICSCGHPLDAHADNRYCAYGACPCNSFDHAYSTYMDVPEYQASPEHQLNMGGLNETATAKQFIEQHEKNRRYNQLRAELSRRIADKARREQEQLVTKRSEERKVKKLDGDRRLALDKDI